MYSKFVSTKHEHTIYTHDKAIYPTSLYNVYAADLTTQPVGNCLSLGYKNPLAAIFAHAIILCLILRGLLMLVLLIQPLLNGLI